MGNWETGPVISYAYPQSTIIQSSRILEEGEDKEKRKDEKSVFVCFGGRLEEWEEWTWE